ncbi:hypothetical protein QBC34DRAFT_476599 [Podospora aff. communis PSN243]|uniref:Retrovirus-related Pol polyprotein from transposon TNT 1-94-like beta-barrel domain-containing protein n=1 Tax=Podospora aff. communis PSN243 TaxID=3040156 RepID=A0AAV9G6G7_9PEZI|nr:hypothetical protein QBC34DRAFT_476599 [Podospora aff. communis PSN243]
MANLAAGNAQRPEAPADWAMSATSNVHAANDRALFTQYKDIGEHKSYVFDQLFERRKVVGFGTISLNVLRQTTADCPSGIGKLELRNVLHVPGLVCNVLSQELFAKINGLTIIIKDQDPDVRDGPTLALVDGAGIEVAHFVRRAPPGYDFLRLAEYPPGPQDNRDFGPFNSGDNLITTYWPSSEKVRVAENVPELNESLDVERNKQKVGNGTMPQTKEPLAAASGSTPQEKMDPAPPEKVVAMTNIAGPVAQIFPLDVNWFSNEIRKALDEISDELLSTGAYTKTDAAPPPEVFNPAGGASPNKATLVNTNSVAPAGKTAILGPSLLPKNSKTTLGEPSNKKTSSTVSSTADRQRSTTSTYRAAEAETTYIPGLEIFNNAPKQTGGESSKTDRKKAPPSQPGLSANPLVGVDVDAILNSQADIRTGTSLPPSLFRPEDGFPDPPTTEQLKNADTLPEPRRTICIKIARFFDEHAPGWRDLDDSFEEIDDLMACIHDRERDIIFFAAESRRRAELRRMDIEEELEREEERKKAEALKKLDKVVKDRVDDFCFGEVRDPKGWDKLIPFEERDTATASMAAMRRLGARDSDIFAPGPVKPPPPPPVAGKGLRLASSLERIKESKSESVFDKEDDDGQQQGRSEGAAHGAAAKKEKKADGAGDRGPSKR